MKAWDGGIGEAEVGFDLGDAACEPLAAIVMNEEFSEEAWSYLCRRGEEEFARK